MNDTSEDIIVASCGKCGGTGKWKSFSGEKTGPCFRCNGTGRITAYAPSPAQECGETGRKTEAQFESMYPEIAEWWKGSLDSSFARSIRDQVRTKGRLTERQHDAALKCAIAYREKAAENAAHYARVAATHVPVHEVGLRIGETLARAKRAGLHRPILRLSTEGPEKVGCIFSLSYDGESVLVSDRSKGRLGIIKAGMYAPFKGTSEATIELVKVVCQEPEKSAVAYGNKFGVCSCCGRDLSNHKSVELGIGPVCRGKFFS